MKQLSSPFERSAGSAGYSADLSIEVFNEKEFILKLFSLSLSLNRQTRMDTSGDKTSTSAAPEQSKEAEAAADNGGYRRRRQAVTEDVSLPRYFWLPSVTC